MGLISTHITLLVIYSLSADTHTQHTHHFTGYLYPKGKYTHTPTPTHMHAHAHTRTHTPTCTHTHTQMYFNDPHRINFKKPGVWSACAWFKSKKQHSCSAFSFYACNTNTMHIRVDQIPDIYFLYNMIFNLAFMYTSYFYILTVLLGYIEF